MRRTQRTTLPVLGLVLALFALHPGETVGQEQPMGQEEPVRSGFWLSAGLGGGSLGCEDCSEREWGFSGNLALGGAINSRVLLGVGTNGWTKEEGGATLTAATLTAQVRFYPSPTGGFFLVGGLGYATVDLDLGVLGSGDVSGPGAVLGLGYDVPLNDSVGLSLFWNGFAGSFDEGDMNVGQIGAGIMVN